MNLTQTLVNPQSDALPAGSRCSSGIRGDPRDCGRIPRLCCYQPAPQLVSICQSNAELWGEGGGVSFSPTLLLKKTSVCVSVCVSKVWGERSWWPRPLPRSSSSLKAHSVTLGRHALVLHLSPFVSLQLSLWHHRVADLRFNYTVH